MIVMCIDRFHNDVDHKDIHSAAVAGTFHFYDVCLQSYSNSDHF